MTDQHQQPDPADAVVTDRAAQRAKELGATKALEALRANSHTGRDSAARSAPSPRAASTGTDP
ncbi:hypothetical protein [Kitasatospora sp. NPDC056800]|uniref:hypothetical protein n=1 Tax=Kitasatospora sp. NPDC056800 TaxID=3345948 RepID=UPI0036BDBAAC